MSRILARLARPILTFASLTLLYSTAGAGLHDMANASTKLIRWPQHRKKAPEFSHPPTKRTPKPGVQRIPWKRGGVWTSEDIAADKRFRQRLAIERAEENPELLFATTIPTISPILAAFQEGGGEGGSEAGLPFPSEGSANGELLSLAGTREAPLSRQWVVQPQLAGRPGGGGLKSELNPNTGNLVSYLPLTGWTAQGSNYIQFSLFHNSLQTIWPMLDVAPKWSHSYNMSIQYDSVESKAYLTTPDGMRWPFKLATGSSTIHNPTTATVHGQLERLNTGTLAFKLRTPNHEDYFFNDDGYLIKISDRDGNDVIITRSSTDNRIETVGDETGRTLDFEYTTIGGTRKIWKVTDPADRVWRFDYDSNGKLEHVVRADIGGSFGHTTDTFSYNTYHQILTHENDESEEWTYTYNPSTAGDAAYRLESITNPLNKIWTYSYYSNKVRVVDPESLQSEIYYDAGYIDYTLDPALYAREFTADSAQNLIEFEDERNKDWTWTYDHTDPDPTRRGDMLTATDPLSRTTTFAYNSVGDLTSATNNLSQSATVTYSSVYGKTHLPISVADAASNTQLEIEYDGYGNVEATEDRNDVRSESTFDSYGNVIQSDVINNDATATLTTTATYDILGRVLTRTDTAGETKDLEYDDYGNLVKMYHEDNSYVQIGYDLESRVISARNELNKVGYRSYDAAGQLTSTTNANGEVQEYEYDDAGRLVTVENALNKDRTYTYNSRGEVSSLTLPDGSVEEWTYDGTGNVTHYTNPLLEVIEYVYNNAGEQIEVDYPTGTDTLFEYDGLGRLKKMTDSTGVSEWAFNSIGLVTSLETPQTGTSNDLIYTYDSSGRMTTMTEPGVGTTTYTYDKFGRPATLQNPYSEVTTWEYDSAGRTYKQIFDDGMYQKFLYDSRSRLEKKESYHPVNGILMRYQYWYNDASQITHALENAKDVYYTYDNAGQLTQEQHSTLGVTIGYTYDANGNRLTRSRTGQTTENYTYDTSKELLTSISGGSDPRSFTYDDAGRTTEIDRGSGNVTSFTYDYESRVTSITRPGSIVDNYTYNGMNARAGQTGSSGNKTFKRNGISVTSPVLSDTLANYTPGISEYRGGTTTFSHVGLKNTNRQHEAGASVWSAARTYDAFGNDMASGWGTFKGPFGYGGQFGYEEEAAGLKLLGHRYYDSSTGRFLTRDPAKAGRNWFSYCKNDPVNFCDPSGLDRHDNTSLTVDPKFKGKVFAVGEVEDDGPFVVVPVLAGEITHGEMDVDYVTVIDEEGVARTYFLPGAMKGTGGMGLITYVIDENGVPLVVLSNFNAWHQSVGFIPFCVPSFLYPIQVEGPGASAAGIWPWDWRSWIKDTPIPKGKLPVKGTGPAGPRWG